MKKFHFGRNAKREDKQMCKRKRSVGCKRLKQIRDIVRRKHVNKQKKRRVSERKRNGLRKSRKRGKLGRSELGRLK
jgi:hypothetical protein